MQNNQILISSKSHVFQDHWTPRGRPVLELVGEWPKTTSQIAVTRTYVCMMNQWWWRQHLLCLSCDPQRGLNASRFFLDCSTNLDLETVLRLVPTAASFAEPIQCLSDDVQRIHWQQNEWVWRRIVLRKHVPEISSHSVPIPAHLQHFVGDDASYVRKTKEWMVCEDNLSETRGSTTQRGQTWVLALIQSWQHCAEVGLI